MAFWKILLFRWRDIVAMLSGSWPKNVMRSWTLSSAKIPPACGKQHSEWFLVYLAGNQLENWLCQQPGSVYFLTARLPIMRDGLLKRSSRSAASVLRNLVNLLIVVDYNKVTTKFSNPPNITATIWHKWLYKHNLLIKVDSIIHFQGCFFPYPPQQPDNWFICKKRWKFSTKGYGTLGFTHHFLFPAGVEFW